MNARKFFTDMASGAAIGIAMIVPGVSGGTIAVLLNVYDDLIGALGNITKEFKKSMSLIVPVLLGAVIAFAAIYFPLKYALEYAPLPTVLLFAGLMIGSIPKLITDSRKLGFTKINVVSVIVPFLIIIGICVAKSFFEIPAADLTASMPMWGYFVLLLVAVLGSCALVVPGISGSMLLMILGYYEPLFETIHGLLENFGHSTLILVIFSIGLILGFFSIAKLMKFFLNKFPRGTRWAIVGFVLGSIPALFITFNGNFPDAPAIDGLQVGLGIVLCVLGAIASYAFTAFAENKLKKD